MRRQLLSVLSIVVLFSVFTAQIVAASTTPARQSGGRSLVWNAVHLLRQSSAVSVFQGQSSRIAANRGPSIFDCSTMRGTASFGVPRKESLANYTCGSNAHFTDRLVVSGSQVAFIVKGRLWRHCMTTDPGFLPNPWGFVRVSHYPRFKITSTSGPSWVVRASGRIQIVVGSRTPTAGGQGEQAIRHWAHATVTFRVAKASGRLVSMSGRALVTHRQGGTETLAVWQRFSHYGRSMSARLPSNCR